MSHPDQHTAVSPVSPRSVMSEPSPLPSAEERVERMNAAGVPKEYQQLMGPHGVAPLALKMGLVYHQMHPEKMVASIPVAGNEQNVGLLHGGAHLMLAETLASLAAILHVRLNLGQQRQVVGVELGATHHRSVTSGLVWGTCTPIKLGRTMTSHEIVMRDDQDNRLSTARMLNMILDAES